MTELERAEGPPQSTVRVAHVVYALHSLAIAVGVVGSATVVGAFVCSVPSIAAVVLNYVVRSDARGSWVESHYRWQIRTFWVTLAWAVVLSLLLVTVIGIPLAIPGFVALTIWVCYRIARGWLRLGDQRAMPD